MSKTILYIDGYNLYYARLKGSPYKWLDVVALFRDQILYPQDPGAEVVAVKFFTAPVKASYARHGQASEHAQHQYHRALSARYPGLIHIIQGFHVFEPASLPTYAEGAAPSKAMTTRVWMIEEKQTDVNIALEAYRDAVQGCCDQLVLCSNDSDLEPALQRIRGDVPTATIGLVMPLREPQREDRAVSNKRLTRQAHWIRHYIRDDELALSQLPLVVPTAKKPARKPSHW
nr:NYN domain-containing protein [uncultured Albidiferax sp.]